MLMKHKHGLLKFTKSLVLTITGLSKKTIALVEVIEGKKKGKLPYGMCRVRISSGIRERLLIQSAIQLIGKEASEKVLSP